VPKRGHDMDPVLYRLLTQEKLMMRRWYEGMSGAWNWTKPERAAIEAGLDHLSLQITSIIGRPEAKELQKVLDVN